MGWRPDGGVRDDGRQVRYRINFAADATARGQSAVPRRERGGAEGSVGDAARGVGTQAAT